MGHGEAHIALYGPPSADEITAGTVDWKGDEGDIQHLVAVYFDKILSNLRSRSEQGALLDRFEEFVEGVRAELSEQRDGTLDARVGAVPLVDEPPPGDPLAEIRVE